ncbi:hypothetical protein Tco_0669336 [Tanacetum coccineum]
MDFGASFHATFFKEELEKFRLCSGKVRLANDKTLVIAGFGDVVLKMSFGTSWTLTDVRYIPGLKRSLVVARGNKHGSLYMVEVPSDGINTAIDGRGNVARWHQKFWHMSEKGMKILASKGRIPDLQKAVNDVAERMNQTLNDRAEYETSCRAPKDVSEDSVTTTAYLINRGPSVPLGFQIIEEEWQ